MAAHLLRHPQDRRGGHTDELPLHRRRDRVLPQAGRGERSGLRARVHRPRGGHRRPHPRGRSAVLRQRHLSRPSPRATGELVAECSPEAPRVEISEDDDAAIYFSSGTTGFPKAILHDHRSIMSSAVVEQTASRPEPRRQLHVHRAAVPHRGQDALLRQPALRKQGRAPARARSRSGS